MTINLHINHSQDNSGDRRQNSHHSQRWVPNLLTGLPFPFLWDTMDGFRTDIMYMDFDQDIVPIMDQALFPPLPTRTRTDSGFENATEVPEKSSMDFFTYEATAPPSTDLDRAALDRLMMDDLPILMEMPGTSWTQCCRGHINNHSSLKVLPSSPPLVFPPVITNYATTPNGHDKYVCSVCKNEYRRRQDCHRHIISAHIKQKTFICPQHGCPGSFCRADVLKRHLRQVHHISDL